MLTQAHANEIVIVAVGYDAKCLYMYDYTV